MQPSEIFQHTQFGDMKLTKRLTPYQIDEELYNKSRELARRARNVGVNAVINLVRPCEKDLYDLGIVIDQLLNIIEDDWPKLRQDIGILKEKLQDEKDKNVKLQKRNYQHENQIRELKEQNQQLAAELKAVKQRSKKMIDDSLYRSDVAYMQRKQAMNEVERMKQSYSAASPYKYTVDRTRGNKYGNGLNNSVIGTNFPQYQDQDQMRASSLQRTPQRLDQSSRVVQKSLKQAQNVKFGDDQVFNIETPVQQKSNMIQQSQQQEQPQQQQHNTHHTPYKEQQHQQVDNIQQSMETTQGQSMLKTQELGQEAQQSPKKQRTSSSLRMQIMQYQDTTQQMLQQSQSLLQGNTQQLALSKTIQRQSQSHVQNEPVNQTEAQTIHQQLQATVQQKQHYEEDAPAVEYKNQQQMQSHVQQQSIQKVEQTQYQTQNTQYPQQQVIQPQQQNLQQFQQPNQQDHDFNYQMVQDMLYSKKQLEVEREQNNQYIANEYARLAQERKLAAMEIAKLAEEREKLERSQQKLDNMAMALSAVGVPLDL